MEEELFPSSMARYEMRGLEEERRLFYVALTRARESCTITYAKSRFRNGQINPARESRFLKDIDPTYLNMDRQTAADQPQNAETDDFWGSMREDRLEKERTITPPKKAVPLQQTHSSIPLSKEAKELQEGDIIEHERFGRGVVTAIEMGGSDRRAFVDFESAGKKQLLLKFARFTIVGRSG
jgi:DNA helicase-2/ATP-dependent DNA helicase PcrA